MQTYYILEDNLERLEKKLARIQNKCNKHSYTFHYKKMEPVYREISDEGGIKTTARFIPVEVFGEVKHEEWRFVGTVDHHEEGNVIRQMDTTLEVPEYYRTTKCICEHCNTRRNRKETHLVYNDTTKEFKQVGKSCLTEYTRGLSAELVTSYIAMFDTLIEGEAPYTGVRVTKYYPIETVLAYAHQCVQYFGYWKTDADRSTRSRAIEYYLLREEGWASTSYNREKLEEELASFPLNTKSAEVKAFVEDALEYVRTSDDHSSYMHNLKVICSSDYAKYSDLGILISLIPVYHKQLEKAHAQTDREKRIAEEKKYSKHVGTVGERITFVPTKIENVTYSGSIYGISYLLKITDANNNIFTWWSSKGIDTSIEYSEITGTIKAHDTYNGVKQTQLTRCKLVPKKAE